MKDITHVAVVGGGTMGNGIAHVFAQNGFSVHLAETSRELADKAVQTIDKNLSRMVAKEKITDDQKTGTLDRITTFTDLKAAVEEADLVIEAVPEIFELKKKIFQQIDEAAPDHTVLATNTSSISITRLAAVTKRPEKCIGMHFFNPVPVMKLVEVINGYETEEKITDKIVALADKLGKVAVPASDSPGFVSNRVLMPMINEAIFCVY